MSSIGQRHIATSFDARNQTKAGETSVCAVPSGGDQSAQDLCRTLSVIS